MKLNEIQVQGSELKTWFGGAIEQAILETGAASRVSASLKSRLKVSTTQLVEIQAPLGAAEQEQEKAYREMVAFGGDDSRTALPDTPLGVARTRFDNWKAENPRPWFFGKRRAKTTNEYLAGLLVEQSLYDKVYDAWHVLYVAHRSKQAAVQRIERQIESLNASADHLSSSLSDTEREMLRLGQRITYLEFRVARIDDNEKYTVDDQELVNYGIHPAPANLKPSGHGYVSHAVPVRPSRALPPPEEDQQGVRVNSFL